MIIEYFDDTRDVRDMADYLWYLSLLGHLSTDDMAFDGQGNGYQREDKYVLHWDDQGNYWVNKFRTSELAQRWCHDNPMPHEGDLFVTANQDGSYRIDGHSVRNVSHANPQAAIIAAHDLGRCCPVWLVDSYGRCSYTYDDGSHDNPTNA